MPLIDADLHNRVSSAWQHHYEHAPPAARHLVQEIARTHAVALVGHFYTTMLDDAGSSRFLSHELVEQRLAASLRQWLEDVLQGGDAEVVDSLIKRQLEVGSAHARIGIPAHLVVAGARMIKQALFGHIAVSGEEKGIRFAGMEYVSGVIDLAVEVMTAAYTQAREHSLKEDEAFRYFVGIKNVGMERERQQGGLLEWENAVVFQLATGAPLANLPLLSFATFGLWYKHKGQPIFHNDPQSATVTSLITECDAAIKALQSAPDGDTPAARTDLLRTLHTKAAQIRQLTQAMFEKMAELESGRDELTHLLNRRFLATVLRREVAMADRAKKSFAVTMVDVDHFKAINDKFGHAAGDIALQSVAAILMRNLRISDYAFRYGGEEFLLVIVETEAKEARSVAERIRKEVEAERVELPGGRSLEMTVSIGVAVHTGHPDYARLVDAADRALYRAKKQGRNRVEMATAADALPREDTEDEASAGGSA